MIAILITFALLILVFLASLVSMLVKRVRMKELNALFRQYNQHKDAAVLVDWIQEKSSVNRLQRILDYLHILEDSKLATEVLDLLDLNQFSNRQLLHYATKAYFDQQRKDETLRLVRNLISAYPGDDSVLDLTVDALISFGYPEEARPLLEPRLERKFKGTQFPKHYARIQALEGNLEKAITIMKNVVNRDYMLATNTIAQPQKGLIEKQYHDNKALLDQFLAEQESKTSP